MKQVNLIVTTAIFFSVLCLCSEKAKGQSVNEIAFQKENKYYIKSSFNNKTYELQIALPKKYSDQDTLHYPVLYILDGKSSFTLMNSIRGTLEFGKEIKDIIIIAIDDSSNTDTNWIGSRFTDYTPSIILQADTLWSKIMNLPDGTLKSGGADNFLNTLEKQVIPYIDYHYKTTTDRGISGHSLGGLLTGYCLLKKPSLFNRYGINSPAFWWNNSEMIRNEKFYSSQNMELSAKVFFSVGGSEDPLMLTPFNAFTNSIKSRNYNGLSMTVKIFDEETHLSVVPACSSRTLKVLYGANVK